MAPICQPFQPNMCKINTTHHQPHSHRRVPQKILPSRSIPMPMQLQLHRNQRTYPAWMHQIQWGVVASWLLYLQYSYVPLRQPQCLLLQGQTVKSSLKLFLSYTTIPLPSSPLSLYILSFPFSYLSRATSTTACLRTPCNKLMILKKKKKKRLSRSI